MKIERVITGPIAVNTYIVSNNNQCIVIDPGGNYDRIKSVISDKKVKAVLLTHGHFDHIGALDEFAMQDIDIFVHRDDLDKIKDATNSAMLFGLKQINISTPNKILNGEEILDIAGMSIRVIHTPGHSKGSVIYIVEDNIFSGDTLFFNSYGRVDLYDGDFYSIKHSIIDKIFALEGEYNVFPGHDSFTKLDYERENNPINYDR